MEITIDNIFLYNATLNIMKDDEVLEFIFKK